MMCIPLAVGLTALALSASVFTGASTATSQVSKQAVTATANAQISVEDAKKAAFTNAGLAESDVVLKKAALDYDDGVAKYEVNVLPEKTGAYQVGARVFAKNAHLPHRQDFECVKWL